MESGTTENRNSNRDLKAEDEALRALQTSLTYLSYDARRVLEALKESQNAYLYDQGQIMIWCHNYGANKTYEVLFAHQQSSLRSTIMSINVDHVFGDRATSMLRREDDSDPSSSRDEFDTPEEQKRKRKAAANKARTLQRQLDRATMPKKVKLDLQRVKYDPRLINFIYLIDQEVLLSDYDVRLDRLFKLLENISEQELVEVLVDIQESSARCQMWNVFHRLEERAGALLRASKEPEGYHRYVHQTPGSMPEDMHNRLQAFLDKRKKARESGTR